MKPSPSWLFIALTLLVPMPIAKAAIEAKIRIVFFTPKDVRPPANVGKRMKEVVDYAQRFYGHWLNHWGYSVADVLPVDRDRNGVPRVYHVRGAETAASGRYDKVGFQHVVREQAITRYKIPRHGNTWWIFVYGTKLKASRGYGGFGDPKGNGWALLVWHDLPGELPLDTPLAGGLADRLNLKGYLHELGHTMNLAHFGPLDQMSRTDGMSLMGPNARAYRKARRNRETKVHLTEATTALIWKQPQITGRFEAVVRKPRFQLHGFRAGYDSRGKTFRITGRLQSDIGAHSVLAIDMPVKGPKDYWKKAHASRLKPDGRFDLTVNELAPSSGTLKLLFCFDNGYFTGNAKGYGYKFSLDLPYRYERNRYLIGIVNR